MTDLTAYFTRIGYEGPCEPTLATLQALQALHPASIPFENIDVMLDRGIDLAPDAVDAKLIRGGRGGYCFEQNSLLKRVLAAIGFQVEGLIARSRWGRSPDDIQPRTHMVLRVWIDDEAWLVDVGFGGCTLSRPLRFADEGPQSTAFDTFRLTAFGPEIRLEAQIRDGWVAVYDILPLPQLDADYVAANWFTSTHPDTHFRHTLMAARTLAGVRYNLQQNRLTIRRPGAASERRHLSVDEMGTVLADQFGLAVEENWRSLFERAVAAAP